MKLLAIDYLLKEVEVRNLKKSLTLKGRFIKADRRKHISSRFFYTHKLPRMVISTCKRSVQVILLLIYSPSLHLLHLSTNYNFQEDGAQAWKTKILVSGLMLSLGGVNTRCTLFFSQGFVPLGFPCKVFNEASIMRIIRYVY